MKDLISMIPRKGKTSNSVSLVFLLLLLSGDVELNPGPGDPRDILRKKSATLTGAISNNLDKVVALLYAEGLIPQQAVEDTSIAAHGNYKKAGNLVNVLQTQMGCSRDRKQYLIDVCNVLKDKNLGDETLATLANDIMLKDLGSTQQGQMNGHANGRTSNGGATVYTSLSIKDLNKVLTDLRNGGFSDESYYDLGLELGLYRATLNNIKADNSKARTRLMECISRWLQRADDVDANGGANWTALSDAVEKINRAAADYIRRQHIMPSQPIEEVNSQNHVEPGPQTTGSDEGAQQLRPRLSHTTTAPSNTESSGTDEADNPVVSNPDYTATDDKIDISDLELYEQVGRGGFGTVKRAKWKTKSKIVAVKIIPNQNKEDFKEAEMLSSLRHENVIQFFGVVTTPSNYYLVTEYAELGSLYDYLRKHDTIDFQQIIIWAKQIAMGMNYLHCEAPTSVIHRDLKSRNVVLAEGLIAKICDLGSSKFYDHTTSMTYVGTCQWIAPEVFKGEKVSTACDVFSYSIILWEMLTCELPYGELNQYTILFKVGNNERLDVPDCPPEFSKLIKQCWSDKPKDRPTFEQILYTLDNKMTETNVSDELDLC